MAGTALETPGPDAPQEGPEVPIIRNNVLLGTDGWLFLHGGDHRQFAFLLSEEVPRSAYVRGFWSNLDGRARYCRERGLPYLHVVFPSKPVVMTRFLPPGLRDRVQSPYRRHFLPAASPEAANRVLHPVDELRALDATERPFLETDTHLSDPGRALVARAALARWNLGYDLDAHFERGSGKYRGDLSIMLGEQDLRSRATLREKGLDLQVHDNRAFLQGNGLNIVLMRSPRSATPLRLAVVGDSFFRDSLRFLAPVFREILYLRGPGFHAETLDRFAPHAVMTGNAERYLAKVWPDHSVLDIRAALAEKPGYRPDEAFTSALDAQLSRLELRWPADGSTAPTFSLEEVAALRHWIDEQQAEIDRARERLQRRDEEIRDLRARKDARIQALRRQAERQEKRLGEVGRHLDQMQASLSWRVTGPVRRLAAVLGRR